MINSLIFNMTKMKKVLIMKTFESLANNGKSAQNVYPVDISINTTNNIFNETLHRQFVVQKLKKI